MKHDDYLSLLGIERWAHRQPLDIKIQCLVVIEGLDQAISHQEKTLLTSMIKAISLPEKSIVWCDALIETEMRALLGPVKGVRLGSLKTILLEPLLKRRLYDDLLFCDEVDASNTS